MRAEVLAIGDELSTGQRLDTNTQWLSEAITSLGIEVAFHTTVGDRMDDLVEVLRVAIDRADVVVATGGLGPTADDLTRVALAEATGDRLVRDEASLEHIRSLLAKRGRIMPPNNAVQADFPSRATPIANPHGTAPGIDLPIEQAGADRSSCRVFALPGVPAELKQMWVATVGPALRAMQPTSRVTVHHRIRCFGAGESQIEAMMPELIAREREPIVGITASAATITLRITASGPDEAACRAAMQPTIDEIYATLGELIYGEEDDELENAVARELTARALTCAAAEWATEGSVSQRLAAAGAAVCGMTVASGEAATRLLSMEPTATAAPDTPAAAAALAEAIRNVAAVDIGLGVAAFPTDCDAEDARLHVAVATPQRTHRLRFSCASHPAIRRVRAAKQALNALRRVLRKQ